MSNKALYASRAGFMTTISMMLVLTYAFIATIF
jgi:hypothetical protein